MRHVHKNSDLSFVIKISESGAEINPEDFSFSLIFYTRRYSTVAFFIKAGEPPPVGITFDNNSIRVFLKSPDFANGEVLFELSIDMPDANFPNGFRTITSGLMHTNVYVHDHRDIPKICQGLCDCDFYLNIQLDTGNNGADGKSAYQIWLDEGNTGTKQDFLTSLKGTDGTDGQSAYELWLEEGNSGSEQDFLNWLKVDQVAVVDELNSTSATDALSANQGRIIAANMLTASRVHSGTGVNVVVETNGDVTLYADVDTDLFLTPATRPVTGVENKIYLIANANPNEFDMWIWSGGSWVTIGVASLNLSEYRKAAAQNVIDATKIDTLTAGNNVSITGAGTSRKISVTGITVPDTFTSTENGAGAVGTTGTYDTTKVTPLNGTPAFKVGDTVIFANGYQSQVVGIAGATFTAATILQPTTFTESDPLYTADKKTLALKSDLDVQLIELTASEANVTFEIKPFTDYVFKNNVLLSGGSQISVTDTAGLKQSQLYAYNQLFSSVVAYNYAIALNNYFKAYWDGSRFILTQNSFFIAAPNIINSQDSVPRSDVLYAYKQIVDSALEARYQKPSAGIPASDMTTDVQTSLGKADTALQSADMQTHNTSSTAHQDMRIDIDTARAIAEGKSRARVFPTQDDLDTWLLDAENLEELNIGDNFYIEDTGTPDYWWIGTDILPLETEKVDLTDYYTKTQTNGLFVKQVIGKGLSTEDYTTTEKTKLAGIETEAQKNVKPNWNATSGSDAEILNKPTITNDFDNTYKALLDFLMGQATLTTLASLPMTTAAKIYADLSAAQSISCSGTPPANQLVHVFARNTTGAAITVTIQTTGSYISKDASVSIPAGGFWEFSIHWDAIVERYRIINIGLS